MGNLMSSGVNNKNTITTKPNYATPELAKEILNKQQNLINKLEQAVIDSSNVLNIDQTQLSSNNSINSNTSTYQTIPIINSNNKIPFININNKQINNNKQIDSRELFTDMGNFYLPKVNKQEIGDYSNAYNENLALLDDPNDENKTKFLTYMYLQEKKLNELQNAINTFPTNGNNNKPINAIKNLNTSTILNVQEYNENNINGSNVYPNYLIFGNNGCLEYNDTWEFKPCNSNNKYQRFNIQQINNINDYNNKIQNQSSKLLNQDSTLMGFYVVNPETNNNKCLKLNNDGLSVMPCNLEPSQRFKPYYHNVIP